MEFPYDNLKAGIVKERRRGAGRRGAWGRHVAVPAE